LDHGVLYSACSLLSFLVPVAFHVIMLVVNQGASRCKKNILRVSDQCHLQCDSTKNFKSDFFKSKKSLFSPYSFCI